jgi:hypothetical protein
MRKWPVRTAPRFDQMPCDMKVLAALMALKATRKTIKLAPVGEGSGAPFPASL